MKKDISIQIEKTAEDDFGVGFELEAWPFYWLTKAYGSYIAKMEDALHQVELDIPRWRVLMLLEGEKARSVSYLSQEAISKLSTMTRIVSRMENDGLVETRARASDARVREVLLTKNGRRARVLAWQKAEEIYKQSFSSMTRDEVDEFNRLLKKCNEGSKGI
ncbi:MarR family winged helix-turn-helix transcriptional regulator [Hirschia litorea]|uniref:MarR family winged helix-turn-helix transcriptional regulator n=1 Tax=Hirschia litorea TaxID=1199156 RepID=A0ABW2IKF2_9PROT